MSTDDMMATQGAARGGNHSSISKLEEKLEGMNLHNTEDVDQTTNYARPVTQEIVKPVVHEQIEEHITRDTHSHDVYHKILPVRDVEVLPARHWVPGPDGRLIQVDEKDVYSGAAWNLGQTTTTAVNEVEQDRVQESHVTYDDASSANQHTERHIAVNEPEVLPGQVKQVFQTQVHQPGMERYHVGLGEMDQGAIDTLGQHPTNEYLASQREVSPAQVHQGQVQHHAVMDQHPLPQKHVSQDHPSRDHITFTEGPVSVSRYESSPSRMHQGPETQLHDHGSNQHGMNDPRTRQDVGQASTGRKMSQPSPSPYEVYETNPRRMNQIHHSHEPQRRVVQEHTDDRQLGQEQANRSTQHTADRVPDQRHSAAQGLFHHRDAEDDHEKNRLYQERGVQQGGDKHHGHHERMQEGKHSSPVRDQADTHRNPEDQTDRGRVSPGLLDPYRVKNGPVHHADEGAGNTSDKPLPSIPEPSVQKIAGHNILTTEDSKGHTKLHKEPKESRHSAH